MLKAIIILSVLIIILAAILIAFVVYTKKTKDALKLATEQLLMARNLFVETSKSFSESVDAKLNSASNKLISLLEDSKNRYNSNSNNIKDKLNEAGFVKKEDK